MKKTGEQIGERDEGKDADKGIIMLLCHLKIKNCF